MVICANSFLSSVKSQRTWRRNLFLKDEAWKTHCTQVTLIVPSAKLFSIPITQWFPWKLYIIQYNSLHSVSLILDMQFYKMASSAWLVTWCHTCRSGRRWQTEAKIKGYLPYSYASNHIFGLVFLLIILHGWRYSIVGVTEM